MPHTQIPVTAFKCPRLIELNEAMADLLRKAVRSKEFGFDAGGTLLWMEHNGINFGEYVTPDICMECDEKLELRIPWHGYGLRCNLEGENTSRTVEYGD